MTVLYFVALLVLGIFSYGFIDPNLTLTSNKIFLQWQAPLQNLVYRERPVATILYVGILIILFVCYGFFLKERQKFFPSLKRLFSFIGISCIVFIFSYPALTYDLFNYITTAKVTYHYHENPYLVMPVEIPNEPYLAFTRAANKVALYGPVWLLLTAIPHYVGGGNIWATIVAFKIMNAIVYIAFCYWIYKQTKNVTNVLFFAFNPLVLIEVLLSVHNDIYMMFFVLAGLALWQQKGNKIFGFMLFFASWWIKGATLVLTPLLFLKKHSWEHILLWTYGLLAGVFFIIAPLREELYPWYALWLITTVALMQLKTHRYLFGFTIVLSFALELRNIPYMWMGYYEGPGPLLRFILTVIPITLYGCYIGIRTVYRRV